jgi:hypothetical protein
MMFYYAALIAIIIVITYSNGIVIRSLPTEPKPCCLPQEHSSQMIISTAIILPDGKLHNAHVNDFYLRYSSFNCYHFIE